MKIKLSDILELIELLLIVVGVLSNNVNVRAIAVIVILIAFIIDIFVSKIEDKIEDKELKELDEICKEDEEDGNI